MCIWYFIKLTATCWGWNWQEYDSRMYGLVAILNWCFVGESTTCQHANPQKNTVWKYRYSGGSPAGPWTMGPETRLKAPSPIMLEVNCDYQLGYIVYDGIAVYTMANGSLGHYWYWRQFTKHSTSIILEYVVRPWDFYKSKCWVNPYSKVRTGLNWIFQGCQRHCATMMTRLASHADGLWFPHHNLKQHHMECNHVHYISLNKHRKWLHHSCQQYGVSVEMNFMEFTPNNTDVFYTAVVMLTIDVERICINTM